jgi:hypothetical protein
MAVGEKHEETNLIVVAGENPEFVGKFSQKPNDLAVSQIATCVVNRLTLANQTVKECNGFFVLKWLKAGINDA